MMDFGFDGHDQLILNKCKVEFFTGSNRKISINPAHFAL